MKITGFSSSPRREANSGILLDEVLESARNMGADTERIDLASHAIAPCTACEGCQGSPSDPCVIDDDTGPMLDALRSTDAIVLASPIYFFSISAQLKCFLDRAYALGGGGRWDALRGKRLSAIFTYGDDNRAHSGVRNAIGIIEDSSRFLGLDLVGIVDASCSASGAVKHDREAIARARALGESSAE